MDSPGIGDVPEMTNIVLDYLMEASAFVFIINTIDGVQISRVCIIFTIFHWHCTCIWLTYKTLEKIHLFKIWKICTLWINQNWFNMTWHWAVYVLCNFDNYIIFCYTDGPECNMFLICNTHILHVLVIQLLRF